MDYLSNVRLDKALEVEEGVFVHNYSELLTALRALSDDKFKDRFDKGRKICRWVRDNYGDEIALIRLERAQKRREFARILDSRIAQLEKEKETTKKIPNKRTMPLYVNVVFFTMFAIVLMSFLYYAFNNDEDSVKKYSNENSELQSQLDNYAERIAFLEKQNMNLKEEIADNNNQLIRLETSPPAPADRIKLEDVSVRNYNFVIYINSSYLAEFTDTGSMLPVLSSNSMGIQIIPLSEQDVQVGDIVSYSLADGGIIIHRVIDTGYDSEGWYAYTKGDNNPLKDKDKVRFSQIQRVLVGVLY